MCKYCESKNNFADVGIRLDTDKHRVYLCGGNNKPPDDERFDFCPKCGTLLGEVKPLTVEQLKIINADMENRKWVWVQVMQTFTDNDKVSAYYRVHMDYSDGKCFVVVILGFPMDLNTLITPQLGLPTTTSRKEKRNGRILRINN